MILNELQTSSKLTIFTSVNNKIIGKRFQTQSEFGNYSQNINVCKLQKNEDGKYIITPVVETIFNTLGIKAPTDLRGYKRNFKLDGLTIELSAGLNDNGMIIIQLWQENRAIVIEDYLVRNKDIHDLVNYVLVLNFDTNEVNVYNQNEVQILDVKDPYFFETSIPFVDDPSKDNSLYLFLFQGLNPDQIARQELKKTRDEDYSIRNYLSSLCLLDNTMKNKGIYYQIPISFVLAKLLSNEQAGPINEILKRLEARKDVVETQIADNTAGKNVVYYGVPGSGKSYSIRQNFLLRDNNHLTVTFHPEYTYYDFLGSIAPVVVNGVMTYEFVPGPFARILKMAISNPNGTFYLIIEELNRANAASVFGDLFQLLDRNYDGSSEYSIFNKDLASYVFGDESKKVSIPRNLNLVCTMNTSDQNVFTLDTAFKRRFAFNYVPITEDQFTVNDFILFYGSYGGSVREVYWSQFATKFNDYLLTRIAQELFTNEDKQIGPWFMKKQTHIDPTEFVEKVLRYVWDDIVKHDKSLFFATNRFDEILEEFKNPEVRLEKVFATEFSSLLWQ